ncbi:Glycine/sarcosine/betaine reductase complex component C subunit alpha [Sporomusa silvacetica DSM 10669]|uniref:Glycine/sarcosine/betaine reductase complex component C subunit alpha n=1 Tax=Sporomusa silvacetica DSM 10669 TaxID=1123289 RepID=A0ABZ3IRG4_9FIRM|nr:glycine/sarcosine/betaine reductase complex component C subunit alpha [Sporomusa silvacetica]OZC20778.1 glycine/sarcosine/betaine reductase complex component C subunit alpha [Sporomusa silvacetica DSM 10669]
MADKDINRIIAGTFLEMADILETGGETSRAVIALTALGSEHGEDELYRAAAMAANQGIRVKFIGTKSVSYPGVETVCVSSEEEGHKELENLLASGAVQGGVTMHYPFPIGVSTVGRVITPAKGKAMYIATTTGTTALDRVEGLVRNALYGIATAKACGVAEPTVGLLNIDGARQVEIQLQRLQNSGYSIRFATSGRSDGGAVMRGNDLLMGSCDVMVTDSLTGNILMKLFSSYNTGGNYESVGYGYGPGMGENFDKLILIVSRASGAPVVKGAIEFAAELVRGDYQRVFAMELKAAKQAGLDAVLAGCRAQKQAGEPAEAVVQPPKEVVTAEIHGIEILDLEDAVKDLWKENIYAESGMGCTGPVVLLSEAKVEQAKSILIGKGYISE